VTSTWKVIAIAVMDSKTFSNENFNSRALTCLKGWTLW